MLTNLALHALSSRRGEPANTRPGARSALGLGLYVANLLLIGLLSVGCGEPLPNDIKGYQDDCELMNLEPIPVKSDDPHDGVKNVYACNVPLDVLEENLRPFPDGAVIVKESTRPGTDYPWLIATARKQAGSWRWNEYSRNFDDEEFLHILASEEVCVDCHKRASRPSVDWIFTGYDAR